MRNQFEYYGKAPEWVAHKEIFANLGIPEGEELKTLVRLCMDDEYREVNYFALEMVQKVQKKQPEAFIEFSKNSLPPSWWGYGRLAV